MIKKLILLSVLMSLLYACQKEAGEGGTSTIKGKVLTYELNHFDVPGGNQSVDTVNTFYTSDKEVFIIYGDEDNFYDDSYETSWDGSFRFEYLRKGKYTIFVYSDCENDTTGLSTLQQTNPSYAQELQSTIWQIGCVDEEYPLKIEVEITDNNTEYNLSDLSIFKIANN